jgi:uncharacterized membrane protein (UPF0127 family)
LTRIFRQEELQLTHIQRSRLLGVLAALALLLTPLCLAPASLGGAAMALEAADSTALESMSLQTATGSHKLSVEVMRTEEGREHGLMNRRYMPADRGMLFDFGIEAPVMMWMKNTYIPLDMIFLSRKGVVTHIAENAEPMSEAIISSGGEVYAVLEVNAGYARKIGLKVGDVAHHKMFGS